MSFSVQCPTCKKNVLWAGNPDRPFCSERCRTVDLGAWACGDYKIPGSELQLPEESEE